MSIDGVGGGNDAEIRQLKESIGVKNDHDLIIPLARKVERLERAVAAKDQELESWKADAQRYRWLRDRSEPGGVCPFYLSVVEAFKDTRFRRETVDAQIDAALHPEQSDEEIFKRVLEGPRA